MWGIAAGLLPDAASDADIDRRWRDIWAAGQGVGAIKAVDPVATVVERLRSEYEAAGRRFARRLEGVFDAA